MGHDSMVFTPILILQPAIYFMHALKVLLKSIHALLVFGLTSIKECVIGLLRRTGKIVTQKLRHWKAALNALHLVKQMHSEFRIPIQNSLILPIVQNFIFA